MALTDLSKTFISLKKLSGKAHTSNEKEIYNEALPTGVTLSSNTIFGQQPPTGVSSPYPYKITGGVVEFLRFPVSFIAGTDTASGRHGFEIKLPPDYETESDNPLAGTYPFKNNQSINITSGSLQIIPPSFAPNYEAKPYYGTIGSGSLIPVADARDWNLDYFNGVFFQQDPPGTGAHAENPDYIEAYLYIGKYLDSVVEQTGDITGVTAGDGLSGGGASGAITLNLDLNSLSAGDVDLSADSLSFVDATDNSVKKETLANIFSGSAGSGLSSTNGVLSVDIDGLNALGSAGINQADNFMLSDDGTEKKVTFSNLEDAIFGNISGQATVAAGGALSLEAAAITAQTEMTGDVADADELMISDGGVLKKVDFSVVRDAVYNDVSGDATIDAGGNLTISNSSIEAGMLNSNVIPGQTDMTGDIADADEFLISDDGALKRVDFSVIRDAVFNDISGDATVAAGGALTIAANAIEDGMINDNVAAGLAGDGLTASSGVLAVQVDDTGIEINSDTLRLKDSGVTNAKLQNSGITFARVGGNSTVASLGDTVSFQGSAGEVTVGENSGVFTIGLPDNVAISTGLTVNGVEATTNTATQTLTNKTLTSPVLNGTISGTSIKDEDDMASNSATHLATQQSIKAYVDSQIAGLDVKASVAAATTASFTMASTASASTLVLADGEGGFNATADTLTIDGVSVAAGQRVLIKDGVNSDSSGVDNKWNGVYTVGALNGSTLTLTRADDFNSSSDFTGAPFFMVDAGTDNGAHGFVSSLTSNPTIGTDPITFFQFSAPGQDAVAGAGLAMTGNVLSVDIDELAALGGIGIDQADNFIFSDGGTEKKVTFSNLEDAIFANISGDATISAGGALTIAANAIEGSMINSNAAGNGISYASNALNLDLNELTDGDMDLANDSIAIIDATDNTTKKETIANIISGSAGDGLSASSGVMAVDLNSSAGLKISGAKLSVEPTDFAGAGLEDDGSDNLRLDINGLTEDSNAGNLSDSIAIADASDSNLTKKITLTQLKTLIDADTTFSAGDGLDLTGTTFSLDLKSSGGLAIDSTELTVDYAGDDSVIKSATDGTSGGENITVADSDLILVQDVTDGNVKYVEASQLPGSGGSGNIGAAEDGDYTDGLFTDFTTSTPVGTPIDRFNEILKLLVPAPAADLDDIDSNVDGVDAKLSFGTSNDLSSASPPYVSVAASAGISAAVDVNGDYVTATNSNNLRVAVFDKTTDIIGDLNEDVAADITSPSNRTNFPANSFGNADLGTLTLEVNGADIHSIDLTSNSIGQSSPGSGTGTHVNGDGSGFTNLSIAANGTFDSGTTFPNFKHRTGRFKVAAASQRDGWNYARVKHNNGSTTVNTNYVEWVNDSNSDALAASSNSLTYSGVGSNSLSGVAYNASGTCQYQVTVDHAYKFVYDSTATTFTTANSGVTSGVTYSISSIAKAAIGGGEDHTKQITVDETDNLTANYILGGSITAGINVSHPLKTNLTNAGQATAAGILIYNVSDSASVTSEPFVSETYRIKSGSYNSQSDAASGNAWSSTESLAGSGTGTNAGHNDGLQVYRERLYAPRATLNSGDFRNSSQGGPLANGPADNPNYSGITTGTRTFYRKFQNTGAAVRDFSYTITGDGTLVGAGDSIGSNKRFKLSFKMPNDGSGNSTGFLDAKSAFVLGSTGDADGGAIGTVDTSTSMTNNVSFGVTEIGTNEFIVAKIEADAGWTGYLENFSVSFGAVGSVSASPNVNNIQAEDTGVSGKLSFGDTLGKSGPTYHTVENTAGNSEVNANGAYSAGNAAASRRGIFDGSTVINGEINETTSASGNSYPANAFGGGSANTGTLKLEVNGSVVRSVDLSSFASGNSLNSNNSGFVSLSAATAGQDGDSLPDFTKHYRTGGYRVGTADQRPGWNYARVIHTIDSTDNSSTYVEWVNDSESRSIATAGEAFDTFAETGTPYYLSGVEYFVSPTGKFKYRIADIYKHVYSSDSDAIDFQTASEATITAIACAGEGIVDGSVSATSRSMPNLNTSVSGAYNFAMNVTGSFSFPRSKSLPGTGTVYATTLRGRVNHPLAGDTLTASTTSAQWLVHTQSDTSTVLSENFTGEARRLQKAASSANNDYDSQSDVYTGGSFAYPWNSQTDLNGATASHNTGLMIYDNKLVSPQRAGHSSQLGDFRGTVDNASSNIISPTGNPNYGTLSNATRDYVRYFQNNTGATKYNFSIAITGTGTIVNSSTSLSGNNFRVFLKLPQTSTGTSTGFLDLAVAFANGEYDDNDGCFTGSFDSSLNATNTGTFGIQGVGANDYIIIKIVADKTWTGNITGITFSWS